MAIAKKKTVKKKVVKKTAVKKAAVKKTAAKNVAVKKKAAVKKKVANKTQSNSDKIKVTLEQKHKMICDAAYYISLEKTHETVNPTEDWLQAEAFINKICIVNSK